MASYRISATLRGHEQDVKSIVSPSNDTIVSGSRDGTVRIWSTQNGKWTSTESSDTSIIAFSSPTASFINSVEFVNLNSHEPLVAAGSQDAMIYLSDLTISDLKPGDDIGKYQLIGHEGNVCSLNYSHEVLISSSWDSTAKVWDLNSFSIKYDLKGHESSVLDAKVISSNKFITCSADKSIRIWEGDHEISRFSNAHNDVIRKLFVFTEKQQFASTSNDGTIKIWDFTGKVLQTLYGHESFVYDINELPNGDLVSTGEDRTVRIWRNGSPLQVITLPCISVWSVAVLSNGDFAVGGSDNLIRVFSSVEARIASEEELVSFKKEVEQSSIAEQSLDDLKRTDIPGYEALSKPGKTEGATLMVKNVDGGIEAHQWSNGEWTKIGDVVGSSKSQGSKQVYHGQEYDYVFDVDIEDGAPPLKLPYNVNENPYVAAERFLADNELPSSYTEEVVEFINKNTAGFNLQEQQGSDAPIIENPYSDSYQRSHQKSSLSVIPEKTYISFVDYKAPQLLNGLKKLNEEQVEKKLTTEDLDIIKIILDNIGSEGAMELVLKYIPIITNEWIKETRLIGYDLLRIAVPRISSDEFLNNTEAQESVLHALNFGLDIVDENSIPLLMMILKVLNNLIDTTLFIQLFVDPEGIHGDQEKKYKFNDYFTALLTSITTKVNVISKSEKSKSHKLYNSTVTTLASLIYNLSAYHLYLDGFLNNPKSAIPIVKLSLLVGDIILLSNNDEAAYRLTVGYGNYLYAKAFTSTPTWISKIQQKYATQERFNKVFNDIKTLS
ncbi:WD40-repeat-containing domain protein [Scheffersomyces amazonensis]|uniref:WD40-repeat-containing domain protein n=1 Tax=Scheffersomyces amazonensis TaxID=1078765 RepID=UPI00315CE854